MTFLIRKWVEKVVKSTITALVAYLTGPKLQVWLQQLGITVDVTQAQAGLWVAYASVANYLKHQKWVPRELASIL